MGTSVWLALCFCLLRSQHSMLSEVTQWAFIAMSM